MCSYSNIQAIKLFSLLTLAGFSLLSPLAHAALTPEVVHHEINVSIEPSSHQISVTDSMHIPASLAKPEREILLNASLKPESLSSGLKLKSVQATEAKNEEGSAAHVYKIEGLKLNKTQVITLRYSGQINTPIATQGEEYARGFSETSGLIEYRGIYLAGSTLWIPYIKGSLVTYDLHTNLPAGWKSVSQGRRISSTSSKDKRAIDHWQVRTPTEEVHLIAARFTEYSRDAGTVKAYAFLRNPDKALATSYLDATAQYMQQYQNMIGPYPYSKFALVENFLETGYGMPSFTLLGEQIIRFPFILTSSYPHELLHNWWGNSVFVDETGGNWCEGLTAYMADHLFAEQRGQGAEHRRDILQRVTDYVTAENDFPPSQFLSRDSSASEAIGYGKTAMVWNMLREKIGDELFLKGVQKFYRDNRFRKASFDDLRLSFEAVSGLNLKPFFAQWIQQTGAPELRLDNTERSGNKLTLTLSQTQAGKHFILDVPVAIYTSKGVELKHIALTEQGSTTADFTLAAPPLRVEVDPQFQVYRCLSPLETPPSLSKAFGASKVLIVTPSGQEAERYSGLIKAWTKEGVEVIQDKALTTLPSNRVVWILGTGNRFISGIADALRTSDVSLTSGQAQIGSGVYPTNTKSLVLTARHPANANSVIVYLSAPSEGAANGLARKLPHYGKYSWLVFGGDAPDNEAKGEWPVTNTPLTRDLAEHGELPVLPLRKALGELAPVWDATSLKTDIE